MESSNAGPVCWCPKVEYKDFYVIFSHLKAVGTANAEIPLLQIH